MFDAFGQVKSSEGGSDSWQYGHCLKEVHFGGIVGSNYIPITKDDSSGEYLAPQFVKTHSDCETSTGGNILEQKPVAYVSGTRAKIKACFITDCTHSYYIRGVGPTISTGQIIFPMQLVTPTGGQALYDWTEADKVFVTNKVKFFDKFTISWQMSEDGTNWIDLDKSDNVLYVTHKAPEIAKPGVDHDGTLYRTGIGYEWFESLLYVSCNNAKDKSDKIGILNGIWSDFTNNEVANANKLNLNYYFHWDLPYHSTNTGYLLENRDGQCYSWCSFLIDLLKIQGIDQPDDLILVDAVDNEWFLIKDWNTLYNPFKTFNTFTPCAISNSYTIISETNQDFIENIDNNYFYNFYYNEVEDQNGVIGQSAPNPESWFQQHCLVYLDFMGKYYDHSYGKIYNSIDDFKNEAIEMWICYGIRISEEIYDFLDPNNNYLPNYDFTGDGELDDFVEEYRAYTTISQLNLTTQTFDR